jgi:hypothetical protein
MRLTSRGEEDLEEDRRRERGRLVIGPAEQEQETATMKRAASSARLSVRAVVLRRRPERRVSGASGVLRRNDRSHSDVVAAAASFEALRQMPHSVVATGHDH